MKKSISNIQLSERPIELNSKRENNSNYRRLDHRAEGLIKVNTILLMKSLSHKSSLVPVDAATTIVFQLEDPFTTTTF